MQLSCFNLAIRFAKETLDTPVLKKLLTLHKVSNPYCKDHPADSDSYLECLIMHSTQTIYHPAGTCKMGPAEDPDAVVDPQLRYKNSYFSLEKCEIYSEC